MIGTIAFASSGTMIGIRKNMDIFVVIYYKKRLLQSQFIEVYEKVLNTLDAIGIGIFTVVGIRTAMTVFVDSNIFLFIFVGVITGVGGGVMRDVLTASVPFVFVKHGKDFAIIDKESVYIAASKVLACTIYDLCKEV